MIFEMVRKIRTKTKADFNRILHTVSLSERKIEFWLAKESGNFLNVFVLIGSNSTSLQKRVKQENQTKIYVTIELM